MKNKRLLLCPLLFVMVATAQVLAYGEAVSETPERVSIEVGTFSADNWYHGGIEEWVEGEIKSFRQSHPDIAVSAFALGPPARKLRPIETLPSLARNVIGLDGFSGYEVAYLASRGEIVPIDNFLPDPDFSLDDFYENLLPSVQFGGKTWGVPLAAMPMVLLCNKKLFEAAGIQSAPETWDEFFDAATRLTLDTDGDGTTDQWGYRFPTPQTILRLTASVLLQHGEKLYEAKGINPVLSGEFTSVLQFIKKLSAAPHMPASSTGDCAMSIISNFMEAPVGMDKADYFIAPIPTDGERVQMDFASIYLAVRKSSPAQEKASWEFVKWLTRKDVALPQEVGGYPCRKDFVTRSDFNKHPFAALGHAERLWTCVGEIEDLGPNNLFGRNNATITMQHEFFDGVILNGKPISPEVYSAAAHKANDCIEVIAPLTKPSYDLYK